MVEVARERGHDVVVLTRSNGIDLVSGKGLDDALRGVDAEAPSLFGNAAA